VDMDEFSIGEFRVRTTKLRHPGTTLGFRLTPATGGPSMAYVTDNELGSGGRYDVAVSWRRDFVAFLKDVDLLIHDAMYTPKQLEQHRGWGHSTYEEAVTLAAEASVKKLVLFHHEPEHSDTDMDALLASARTFAKTRGSLEVIAAQEGMQVTL
jgi:ribonuclease BN (tRNA processing enzyme)